MEELIKSATVSISQFIEVLAALIILYASLIATFQYIREIFVSEKRLLHNMDIRLNLGKSLAIALELLLGADILKTAVAPSWTEIGQLAAIATLRTALNYFLERELKISNPKT